MTPTTRRDRVGAEYAWVPPGAGLAGCWMMRTPVTNAMRRAAVEAGAVEPPRRTHWMMRTPVTNAMWRAAWRAAVAAGAVQPLYDTDAYDDAAKAQHPVVRVSREHARAYAAWVGGRLPRDAEWARVAQGDDGRTYPWGEQPPDRARANYGNIVDDTTPVDAYPAGASPYGLLDMAGNVWEWVDDGNFVVRGGAFDCDAGFVVCGAQVEIDKDGDISVGFRVVSPGP